MQAAGSAKRLYIYTAALIVTAIIIWFWEPTALVYGIQRGSLYAVVALPLALILGILGVLNLAHGEFLTVGLYATYTLFRNYGWDPMASAVPVSIILAVVGIGVYLLTVRQVRKAGHLSQLLITFGIALVLSELLKSIYTTQPRAVFTTYSYAFTRFAGVRFGIYEFVYLAIALGGFAWTPALLEEDPLGPGHLCCGTKPHRGRHRGH